MRIKKRLFSFLVIAITNLSFSQEQDYRDVKESIEIFFKGFHQRDSSIIKSVVAGDIILQSIGRDNEGHSRMRTDSFGNFLKSIVSIPDSLAFKEEIHEFHIQVDGPLAHAWTPYTFWINDKKSHCGVNSFQLFNDDTSWKIIYLVDTRRKEDCTD